MNAQPEDDPAIPPPLTMQDRERVWQAVAAIISTTEDLNTRAVAVQNVIADYGPVPDSLGDLIRNLLKGETYATARRP